VVHKKFVSVILKALVYSLIFLASYTILGLLNIIAINIDFLLVIGIGFFAYFIRETLRFTPFKRWL